MPELRNHGTDIADSYSPIWWEQVPGVLARNDASAVEGGVVCRRWRRRRERLGQRLAFVRRRGLPRRTEASDDAADVTNHDAAIPFRR